MNDTNESLWARAWASNSGLLVVWTWLKLRRAQKIEIHEREAA